MSETQRYLDPTNDVAFKKLFYDKVKLIDLLNCILKLPEGRRIKDLDYGSIEQPPSVSSGKKSLFDLRVKDEEGNRYIVEMQRKMQPDYLNRAQYYGSYTYVNQLDQGMLHHKLLPVLIVSIIGTKAFPDSVPCISHHSLREDVTNQQYLSSVGYVFVELGKFNHKKITNTTDEWLHMLKCAAKEQEPPKEIKSQKVLSAYQALEQFRWTKEEHDAYVRSRLAEESEEETMEAKYKEGKAEGIAEGEAKGKAEGKTEGIAEIIKMLLTKGNSIETISAMTGISKEEIEKLVNKE